MLLIVNQVRDMFGELIPKRFRRAVARRNLTIWSLLAGLLVIALIAASMIDFVRTALAKDEKVQESTLKGELAQFILAVREDDGSSLLENVVDFGSAKRELGAVAMRSSFFAYFLTLGNSKQLNTKNINWEPPRACSLDFVDQSTASAPRSLRTCFAVVPNDPNGRYIYFSLRYPTHAIVRHRPGLSISNASSVLLRLRGENSTTIRLMFEQPRLAQARFPSQLRRFADIHEVTAYPSDQLAKPLRSFQGQAFEKRMEASDGASGNYVTLLGRIELSLLFNSHTAIDEWTKSRLRDFRASVEVHEIPPSGGPAQLHIEVPFGAKGTALQSLEQAYYTFVQSRANLDILDGIQGQKAGQVIWGSASITGAEKPPPDVFQMFSDWWANLMVAMFDYKRQKAQVDQVVRGRHHYRATLTAEPILLPDLATRAFLGLSGALFAVVTLGIFWLYALWQLNTIARKALRSAKQPSSTDDMGQYRKRQDEIGSMGRTFNLLIRRFRSRNATIIKNTRKLERQREERSRLADEQIKTRHDVLRAIGHEIRSPLQSLLNRTEEHSDLRLDLEKMQRAVDALYFSASVEAGLKERRIVVKLGDISEFMHKLTGNLVDGGMRIVYRGPESGVLAIYDPIALDEVLSSVLDNANRHMYDGSYITLNLVESEATVQLLIHNVGQQIPEEDLDAIFGYGFSTHASDENMGLGLFSARIYVLGMRGIIKASNVDDGVTFTITLPRSLSES